MHQGTVSRLTEGSIPTTAGEGPRVLIVDDDPQVRRLLVHILESRGFTCDVAGDAAEARRQVNASQYALAVVDLVLPDESGLSMLRFISQEQPHTALVVVSGLVEPLGREELGEVPIYGYITKPFTQDQALVTVVTALRCRELEGQQRDQNQILERSITERTAELRKSLLRLQETETELRRQALIFENLHDGVIIVDPSGRILDFNPGAEALFGYTREEVIGRVPDLLSPGSPDGVSEDINRLAIREGRWRGEMRIQTKDGSEKMTDLVVVPLRDAGGELIGTVGLNRDITDRWRAETALQQTIEQLRRSDEDRGILVARLVTAQEEERHRIASDIHDFSIQKMTAAFLRLDMLRSAYPEMAKDADFEKAKTGITQAIDSMRHLMFELRPYVLDRDGLIPALRLQLAEESSLAGSPEYQLESDLGSEPPEGTRVILYRLAHESLINVRKHARAAHVLVHLADRDDGYAVRIEDDGCGFDASAGARSPEGHIGLSSMRERAQMAGGWLEVRSTLGKGTIVEFWVPAGQEEEREASEWSHRSAS